MNSWNNADELSQVSSINCSGPCYWKLFALLRQRAKYTGTLYQNLFPYLCWLSKSEVQLDTKLCLVSGHIDTTPGFVCVSSSSGAMGKVGKPVAAVASVSIGPYYSQCLMSHVWVLSPPVPYPVPVPVKTLTSMCGV